MTDTQLIERYIFKQLSAADALLVEARSLSDAGFKHKLELQRQVHGIAKIYGRNALKQEIAAAEKRLFSESRFAHFRAIVSNIFR